MVLLVGGGFCACAACPAAVDVRIGLARIIERERVLLRRVARLGAACPCICAVGRRFRRAFDGIALVDELCDGAARLDDVDVRLYRGVGVQLGFHGVTRAAADVDAGGIFHERLWRLACRARRCEGRPIDIGRAARDLEHGIRIGVRRIEGQLLEA